MIKRLFFTRMSEAKASDEDIAQAEVLCGVKFPVAFREFCVRYNGGYPDERNNFYFVPDRFREFNEEYGREDGFWAWGIYGLAPDFHQCSVIQAHRSLSRLAIPLFPLAYDPGGNELVIKAEDPEGPVYFRDHELWIAAGTPKLFHVADGVAEFYNGLEESRFGDA